MEKIFLGMGTKEKVYVLSNMLNRHGLIAGATGTGKTVTLKLLAESFSNLGIPIFLPDVKGDLLSFCEAGKMNEHIEKRMHIFGMEQFEFKAFPVRIWDFFTRRGIPLRTTISEMGPLLLAKLFNLNDTQTGVLQIAFRVADDKNLLLLDIKDLKAILLFVGENAKDIQLKYGNVSSASIGAIQRGILNLEAEGADTFFGEPALDIMDFFIPDPSGRGPINILNARQLYQKPGLYSAFLLWFLSELYENMPEVGDLDKPKCVFFFDEAHLMFNNCSKILIEKIEQIIRLIRSKGVSIFFVTQNPTDIPETVLSQLGNRIQHALRAFTPKDKKAIDQIAMTFRINPELKIQDEITSLKTGEALVSVLQEDGSPSITDKVLISSPASKIGTVDETLLHNIITSSPLLSKYKDSFDRESAHEILTQRFKEATQLQVLEEQKKELAKQQTQLERQKRSQPKNTLEKMSSQVLNGFSRSIGHQLARGIMGSLKKMLK